MANVRKMHLHRADPVRVPGEEGQELVQALCPRYDTPDKVVSITMFRDWRAAGYSKEPFCGDCVRELGSQEA